MTETKACPVPGCDGDGTETAPHRGDLHLAHNRAAARRHTVRTTHIQRLIANAASLAERVDGHQAGCVISFESYQRDVPEALIEHALCKAISDLRHAAEELDAERLSCFGWRQQ